MRSPQVVSGFEELDTDDDAGREADQSDDRVEVPTGEAEQRPPRAAEERQCADHGEDTEDEADDWSRTDTRVELSEQKRRNHRAENEADDLRADVLDGGGAMSPRAPAMSRSKQATQMPILDGLPQRCRSGASSQ